MKTNYLLFFVLILLNINLYSQSSFDKVYFSITGDTVLYSFTSLGHIDSDSVSHRIKIVSNSSDTINNISTFNIKTHKSEQNPYYYLSKDTITKYGLSYDGPLLPSPDKSFKISVKIIDVKQTDVTEDSNENIFLANVSIVVKCKSKIILNEIVKYMFQGKDVGSFKTEDLFKIYVWKKENKEKYLVWYSIVRNKIVTKNTIGSGYDMQIYISNY